MTRILCEVALINESFVHEKRTTKLFQLSRSPLSVTLWHWITRTRLLKGLAVASLRCWLSDGMINEARPRAHPSRTREALAIAGGISHTEPSEYRLSHRQQHHNAAEPRVDNPSKKIKRNRNRVFLRGYNTNNISKLSGRQLLQHVVKLEKEITTVNMIKTM